MWRRQNMAHGVCPWWIGYWLASPIRKLRHNPVSILAPFVHEGMTVLEPGPGMGFFTLEMARMVGKSGRIIAIDIQPKMLRGLSRRAQRKGVRGLIELRLADSFSLRTSDLNESVDFVLAFAVVHELPDSGLFFRESYGVLRPGGKLLFSEPAHHIERSEFAKSLDSARLAGFEVESMPTIKSNLSALLAKKLAEH
jgi:ubiquinone/menaquinone biosynthesis C-methylase UbiE